MPAPDECRTKGDVRAEIDRIDDSLVSLLAERFAYVRRMAELKQDPADAHDAGRIDAILSRVAITAGARGLDPGLARDLWQRLIDWNVAWERAAIGRGFSAPARGIEAFRTSLAEPIPPLGFDAPLIGLWHAARGEWEAAHEAVREEGTPEAAWVHAHLHRIEGDLDNAGYWYGQAGRSPSDLPLDEEREAIAMALLVRR